MIAGTGEPRAAQVAGREAVNEKQAAVAPRCRHRTVWLFTCGPLDKVVWCWTCGAIRSTSNGQWSRWQRPVGPGGENPAMKGK